MHHRMIAPEPIQEEMDALVHEGIENTSDDEEFLAGREYGELISDYIREHASPALKGYLDEIDKLQADAKARGDVIG